MFSNAGTLLDRLQGLFSKGFLVGGIVPLVLLFFINWGLLWLFAEGLYSAWLPFVLPPKEGEILYWVKVILILFSGGLVIWNLNPWFRQLLEMRFLPRSIYNWLGNVQRDRYKKLSDQKDRLAIELFDYRSGVSQLEEMLQAARKEERERKEGNASENLKTEYDALRSIARTAERIPFKKLESFAGHLKEELLQTQAKGNDLARMQGEFIALIRETRSSLEYDFDRLKIDIAQRFPSDYGGIGPTRMANFSSVHREYGVARFGLDVEHFWIRLLKVIRGDKDFYPMLEEAKNQLDFGIAFTIVLGATTLVWIPFSFLAARFLPFLLITFLGPLATTIAYHVAVQSYRGFTEVVRSAIDLNRFQLLELLHIELPADSESERACWKALAEGKLNITYRHSASTDKSTDTHG